MTSSSATRASGRVEARRPRIGGAGRNYQAIKARIRHEAIHLLFVEDAKRRETVVDFEL
jgi:hypothetical protein